METQINFNLNNVCWSEMWNLHSSTTFLSICLWVLSSLTWNEWITHQHLASAGEASLELSEGLLLTHTSSSWCRLLIEAWAGGIVQNISIWLSPCGWGFLITWRLGSSGEHSERKCQMKAVLPFRIYTSKSHNITPTEFDSLKQKSMFRKSL